MAEVFDDGWGQTPYGVTMPEYNQDHLWGDETPRRRPKYKDRSEDLRLGRVLRHEDRRI